MRVGRPTEQDPGAVSCTSSRRRIDIRLRSALEQLVPEDRPATSDHLSHARRREEPPEGAGCSRARQQRGVHRSRGRLVGGERGREVGAVSARRRSRVRTTKSRKAREIFVPAFVRNALISRRRQQAVERLAVGPAWADSDLVFTTASGTPVDPRNFNRVSATRLVPALVPRCVGRRQQAGHRSA
jgi:hypothetical protein